MKIAVRIICQAEGKVLWIRRTSAEVGQTGECVCGLIDVALDSYLYCSTDLSVAPFLL
jgi:hypothetical protein